MKKTRLHTVLILVAMLGACGIGLAQVQRTSYVQSVGKAGTAVALASSSNPAPLGTAVVLTARVVGTQAAVPSGSVEFDLTDSGGNLSKQTVGVDANGSASWSPTLTTGIYSVVAQYTGDGNYLGSASNSLAQNVMGPADFTILLSAISGSVLQGDTWTPSITLKSVNGFNSKVALSCSNLPEKMTCNLGSTSVTPTASGASTTMSLGTIATTVATASAFGFFFALVPVRGNRRKRNYQRFVTLALLSLLLTAMVACGTGGMRYTQTDGTPKGTYDIIVTGTSGTITHTQHVSLTVR